MTHSPPADLLATLEAYYDAAPRRAARAEQIGPFTLFVNPGLGWRYYARPSLGATEFRAADVLRVRARQRELGIPEAFEWVAEATPALRAAVEAGGLAASDHPLLLYAAESRSPLPTLEDIEVRLASPDDDVALFGAVARVAFAEPGTAAGQAGTHEAAAWAATRDPAEVAFERERLRAGASRMAVALYQGTPVGIGSHNPVGDVTEVVGVGVLPAFRRRGAAAALTAVLVDTAQANGARTVFLSARDEEIGRVYARVGFRLVATACTAEPLEGAQ